MSKADIDTRAMMVLSNESRRMREAAERVDLVVQAMALRRGVRPINPRQISDEFVDGVE